MRVSEIFSLGYERHDGEHSKCHDCEHRSHREHHAEHHRHKNHRSHKCGQGRHRDP
jgi:hypothetical protein